MSDFYINLDELDVLSRSDPALANKLLWKLWKASGDVKCIQLAIRSYSSDLGWRWDHNAIEIARLIGESYEQFPELYFVLPQEEFASSIGYVEEEELKLWAELLRLLALPPSSRDFSLLMVEVVKNGDIHLLRKLIPMQAGLEGKPENWSRLMVLLNDHNDQSIIPELAGKIAEILHSGEVAKLMLGKLLINVVRERADEVFAPDVRHFSQIMTTARGLLNKTRRPSAEFKRRNLSSSALVNAKEYLGGRSLRAERRRENMYVHRRASGQGWIQYMLEFGSVELEMSTMYTAYGKRVGGVAMFGVIQPDLPFLYGPNCSLSSGFYAVNFWGFANDQALLEFKVTVGYGAQTVVKRLVEAKTQDGPTSFVKLFFDLPSASEGVEFCVAALSGRGALTISLVTVERVGN